MFVNRRLYVAVLLALCIGAGYLAVKFPLSPPESATVECARKCHPLPSHLRVQKINPFISAESWRNTLGRAECVCGSSS